jgi:hypothetical protein
LKVWLTRGPSLSEFTAVPKEALAAKTGAPTKSSGLAVEQKNRTAQLFLDYAEAEGMITADERRGKFTTVQRFLGNDVLREVLGLDQSDQVQLQRIRPKDEFDILARRFTRDLLQKTNVPTYPGFPARWT